MSTKFHSFALAAVATGILTVVGSLLLVADSSLVEAATFTVTKTEDTRDGTCDADCSLREAIDAANAAPGADTINLPAGTYALSLAGAGEDGNNTGDLDITDDLTLVGDGAASTIIDGVGADRVLHVQFDVLAQLSGLTVQNGSQPGCTPGGACGGGGILNSFGDLTVADSVIQNNVSDYGGGGVISYGGTVLLLDSTVKGNSAATDGGGLWNHGSGNGAAAVLTITRSTLSGNTAVGQRGGGIIHTFGSTVDITNSTISGNTANRDGGAVHSNDGFLTLTNSTVTANSSISDTDSGLLATSSAVVTLSNTIIANQVSGTDCSGAFVSTGYNLDSDDTCDLTAAGDLSGVDPLLDPLQDNGGPTLTHALLGGSPAIDVADATVCPSEDQRGVGRPQGVGCDIGAFEVEGGGPPPEPVLDVVRDLEAEAIARDTIVLSWTDTSVGEDGYELERAMEGGPFQPYLLLPADSTFFPDQGLLADTTYSYRIKAFVGASSVDWSNPAQDTTFPDIILPPIIFPWLIVNSPADTDERDGTLTLREAISLVTGQLGLSSLDAGECAQIPHGSFDGICTSSQAIGSASADGIVFDPVVFPADNPTTIALTSALPPLDTGHDGVFGSLGLFDAGVIVDGFDLSFSCISIIGEISDGNIIQGLQVTGCYTGVFIGGGADDNLIGGAATNQKNVVFGNEYGVRLYGAETTGNEVHGNYLGTDSSGTLALPNEIGVEVYLAEGNEIGGADTGEGNLISGNTLQGANIQFADGNSIEGNLIGTDMTGLSAVPNGADGVLLDRADNNVVGPGNVISGNVDDGVHIFMASDNKVVGNLIGTDATGFGQLPNLSDGVLVDQSTDNTVGTVSPSMGNTIAYNQGHGVNVLGLGYPRNVFRGNSIHTNDGLGIANDCCRFPTLNLFSPILRSDSLYVSGAGSGDPGTDYHIDFYLNTQCDPSGAGEGEIYLDSVSVTTSADGSYSYETIISGQGVGGEHITATTTGPLGTRQFISCRQQIAQPPVQPADLGVRCMHSPIWPTSSDEITITAEALDASLNPVIRAERVEIWVNGSAASSVSDWHELQHTVGPFPDGTFSYGCRVEEGNGTTFSGWRVVTVGFPDSGSGVPVIYTGASSHKVDIVFIADTDSYPRGALEDRFLQDVEDVIRDAYFSLPLFLENQDKFNFWIAGDPGKADRFFDPTRSEDGAGSDTCSDGMDNGGDGFSDRGDVSCNPCVLSAPGGWFGDLSFADAGAILHTDSFRDCARGRLFSSEPGSLQTVLHETGHSPFGLADEYCCNTAYYEPPTLPNLYESLLNCRDDAPDVGRRAGDCRQLTDGTNTVDFWTSDPDPANDLMASGMTPGLLDVRKIEWYFAECEAGNC